MTQYTLNRLEATRLMGPLVDDYWEKLRRAHEEGYHVAWCVGPLFMIPKAAGCRVHFHAGYASYCAGRKAHTQLLEAAEGEGHPIDMCSYIKLHAGHVALERKGVPIREDIRLPRPDVIFVARYCQEHGHLAEILHRQLGTPLIIVDVPPVQSEEEVPGRIRYVERQLREEAIPTLERLFGRPYDYDRLSQVIADLKVCATLRNECAQIAKHKPSPWTLTDMCVSIAPTMYLMGEPGTIEYYQALKEELLRRVEQGISAVLPEERFRLYYDSYIMWGWLGPLTRKVVSFGGNIIAGRYPWMMFPEPEYLNPEDPIHTVAEQLVRWMLRCTIPDYFLTLLDRWLVEYAIDGLIMLSSPTCRLWLAQHDIIDEVQSRHGIPGVIIEADMIDPKFYNEALLDTRLQALFEMMEARKARG